MLIHGIGEQMPMDTLRGFVDAVWSTNTGVIGPNSTNKVWSKPDDISQDFELRRLTTDFSKNADRRTDFFEFYWADVMNDTRMSQVTSWIFELLFRKPWRIPRQLQAIWWFMMLLFVAILAAWGSVLYRKMQEREHAEKVRIALVEKSAAPAPLPGKSDAAFWFGVIAPFVWGGLSVVLVKIVGDAAVYLRPKPPNITARRKIRAAGVDLLRKLHDSGKYQRIILVGHSLGTVIGYDILTHSWPSFGASLKSGTPALVKLEELIQAPGTLDPVEYQKVQRAYHEELKAAGCKWLVTDFVTLGSPLAHASLLMARNAVDLKHKKDQREFPSCPPVLEADKADQKGITYESNGSRVPHHATVFAPVRWTNLYFKCKWTLWGDFVGGEVRKPFGPGIRDVEVKTNLNGDFFTHTCYWTPAKDDPQDHHIEDLRDALKLDET